MMEQMFLEQSEGLRPYRGLVCFFKHPPVVKGMKTNDDKSVTDSHTKSVEDEAYNEKVIRSELLSSTERKTPATKIIWMEDFFMASHKKA